MWWVLSALVILIFWALKFILNLAWWIPITATVVVVLIGVALFIVSRLRARRAASALERAIAQQGAQQALNARPERRAEIQELQKQVQGGINALKMSKLGAGRKSGAAALYSLPWYVIIGPPGAGKTTALKHSGLVFPYADPRGGGVRGVGGTRNCDWWFTNEGILLDTAGRYATEQDDHDEWIAFLQMLRKYRSKRPINGILVAISVAELIDATEQQIELTGKKLRARIDEVMTQLHMIVPVYILFTKCDLVAGFGEFFGDLRKSDRAQAWGTTLRLNQDKSNPGHIFETEFDTLVKQLHARALKRLAMERNREARERLFQFPLEFAGMRRNLAELVATIFMVNAFQGTPIFRGFYFTSGTQEGRPLDRVLARMGHAMGIRPPETAVQQVVESKSYFLHDVFMNVVFPDGDIAARSQSEMRRQKLLRIAVSAAALSLAAILAAPAVVSFVNNRRFLRETEQFTQNAQTIQWNGRPPHENLEKLKPLLDRLKTLDDYRQSVPMGMGWMMYRGDTLYRPAVTVYVKVLQDGFVLPCKQELERRLKAVTGNAYLRERTDLKTYLMMSDVEHLDVDWETARLTTLWAEILRPSSRIDESVLKNQLVEHVGYYLLLLKEKTVLPIAHDTEIVAKARTTLQQVPVQKRYFDLFVNSLSDEKIDEAGDNSRANKRYPPLTLNDMFTDRPEVLKVLTSKRHTHTKEQRWQEIEGPYTDRGHHAVRDNIIDGATLLKGEHWVVPLQESEDQILANLKRLAEDYDDRYIEQWNDFLADIHVRSPANVKDAIDVYNTLTRQVWPYLRILHRVEDDTQWKKPREVPPPVKKFFEAKINMRIQQATGLRPPPVKLPGIEQLKNRVSRVPAAFKKTVEFGIPVDTRGGPITDTPLNKYIFVLSALRDDMQKISDSTPNPDIRQLGEKLADASKQADALLQQFDDNRARTLLSPLLQNPLRISDARLGLPGRFPQPPGAPPTLAPGR